MGIFSKFIAKIKGTNDFAPADWKELEEELLLSDLGPALTKDFLDVAQLLLTKKAHPTTGEI